MFCVVPVAFSRGLWGVGVKTLFNVGKVTKKYFSVQIGRYQGVGRELVGINVKCFYILRLIHKQAVIKL